MADCLRIAGFSYKKCKKNRIRPEKSESEILVNGFILARINRKSKPEVEEDGSATAPVRAVKAHIT
jgi:hypothetical protein